MCDDRMYLTFKMWMGMSQSQQNINCHNIGPNNIDII